MDDNAATGDYPFSNFFGASASLGVEYGLYVDGVTGTSIAGVFNNGSDLLTPVLASYPGSIAWSPVSQ